MVNYEFVHMEEVLSKTREHSGQDSVNHPRMLIEGNPLWIDMMESLSAEAKKRLEGSEYAYYRNMYFHLKKSPYKEAAAFAERKAEMLYVEAYKKSKDKNPLISVIIPCYNQGKYVDDAVNSVLKQTYENYEIIIINDGSTDEGTNIKLANYKRPKTKVYTTKNQGLPRTRNYGVKKAKGDFIQFLDADDFISSQKLEDQIRAFQADSSLDVSYTSYSYFFEKDGDHKPPFHGLVIGPDPLNDFLYRWQRGLSIPIHCALFKKDIFNTAGPFVSGMKGVEDWIMWVDVASRGAIFSLLNDDMATYRVQEKSVTTNGEHMFYWACRAVSYIAERYVPTSDMDEYDRAQQKYLKFLADYLLYNSDTVSSVNTKAVSPNGEGRLLITGLPLGVKKSLPYRAVRLVYRKGPMVAIRAVNERMRHR